MEELADKNKLISDKQKELYVATLAHDLKNPLNAQIVTLEQFYKEKFGVLTEIQKEILKNIISSSKFMREMLSSLLLTYKIDNGNVRLEKTLVNIDELIKDCLKEVSSLCEENNIFITYSNNTKETNLLCDKNYIKRVILNLLNNTIMYSYKNTKPIFLLEDDDIYINLRIKSIGIPIDENLKSHIFDKYNCNNNKMGTGLGLYFCKQVIKSHAGVIDLKSKNSNIEFLIRLPKNNTDEDFIKFK